MSLTVSTARRICEELDGESNGSLSHAVKEVVQRQLICDEDERVAAALRGLLLPFIAGHSEAADVARSAIAGASKSELIAALADAAERVAAEVRWRQEGGH